jgi:acetyl esterase
MTDYPTLIDADIWAFIEKTSRFYPPDIADYSIQKRRDVYNTMCRGFFAGYPEGVSAENKTIGLRDRKIAVRRYRAMRYDAHALVVYYHGGGFVAGGLDSHDDICAEICHRTGYEVLAVDYRLAPEHPHPAPFEDALAAYRWVADGYDIPIVLAGDSAGGNLAAAVAHATRTSAAKPIGQMLIYPLLGGEMGGGSFIKHAHAPLLTLRDLHFYRDIRADGRNVARDPTFAPLAATEFSGLPPTVIITAEYDPLSSDGEDYRNRIVDAGGKAWRHDEAGLVHGYLRARHSVSRARESFTRIVDAIRMLGRREWTYPIHGPKADTSQAEMRRVGAVVHPID